MSQTDKMMEKLRRKRGELKLKMHLAGEDVKQEWAKLEKRFQKLKARADHAGDETEEALDDIGEEIERGYERIKKSLD